MIEEQNKPTVEKKTNMRRFAGFTPQQVEKLLRGKGLKPNSREAAEYLSAMSDKAEQMLMQSEANTFTQGQGFQYGGSVGGFDDKSQKLFDAAVKRTASTEPKSPEVQRYIDNVIETRGRPTMVYPTTADPLQGYQEGGAVAPELGVPRRAETIDDRMGFFPIPPEIDFPPGIPQNPNLRDPLPTPPTTIQPIVADVKSKLNQAQAQLSAEQGKVSALQQQLANTPIEDEDAREKIINQINQAMPQITRAEAAVANASQAFQSSAVPTAAEAVGATVSAPADLITRQPVDVMGATTGQTIDPETGRLAGRIAPEGVTAETTQAEAPTPVVSSRADVATTAQDVQAFTPQERFGEISKNAVVNAQQQATQELNVRDVVAAQGTGQQITSPAMRALQQGELVSGAANAEQSAQFLEGVEAATGSPSSAATVQGQLTNLMTQFEGGTPPTWAAGAMRQATAIMAQRGMAASSMAGQAIVQAAMESALPIALQDAQTVAQFEAQNLSNRQQRAMLAAQQRSYISWYGV